MTTDILLVDDEQGIRKVLGIALADRGYRVHTAADARQALALFDELGPPIVLTDIKMPGMDGIELLRALKRRNPETEVIMITGHGETDLAIRSLKYEATDYISKPIDDDILDVALKRALERISLRAQLREYTENLERMVEEKSRRLIQAERLAAMGETVAGLAHAIKNITGSLRGGLFVVDKGFELQNQDYLKQGWRMVRDNVARVEQLSLDLLDIAKPGRPDVTPTDPAAPLRAVFDLMFPRAEAHDVRMTLQCAPDLRAVPMDPEAINRCLLNLVVNALEACNSEPNRCLTPTIALTVEAGEEGVCYHVSDNCGGMTTEVQARLFKGFFTTKGSRGTGIGLMLARKIVENHQGRIAVSSTKGAGTTFEICLPWGHNISQLSE
ncbi:sensor histidine kinase [Desulfatitalea tepidiphila]|uniref:sensor histidine kinase n=1 Tax=Desulfatitalea tepidiphila TaxID=1185843 RepID=UPI0006B5A775|nr:response regulator [Desulfatitalea tepidiphila]